LGCTLSEKAVVSMAIAAKAREQPSLAKPSAVDLKVTMSDWNISTLTKLPLHIFSNTVSILVSMDSVDIPLSFKL